MKNVQVTVTLEWMTMGERPRYYTDGTWHLDDTHLMSIVEAEIYQCIV
jgi:hypothetical protein